jgi:hypothetical protein
MLTPAINSGGFVSLEEALPNIQHVAGGRGKTVALVPTCKPDSRDWILLGLFLPWTTVTIRIYGTAPRTASGTASYSVLAISRHAGTERALNTGAQTFYEIIAMVCGMANLLIDVQGYKPILQAKESPR